MVQRDDGRDDLLDPKDAVAEALIVVDEIELAGAGLQLPVRPGTERERLAEGSGEVLGGLEHVFFALHLPIRRQTARILVVEDVETGQLVQRHPLVEDRVRLAGEDLDLMAEIGQGLGEMTGVHALTPDMGLAPVREIGDAQGSVRVRG